MAGAEIVYQKCIRSTPHLLAQIPRNKIPQPIVIITFYQTRKLRLFQEGESENVQPKVITR
jgi:hypothetical protein